jgi:hypothetical protein
MYSTPKRHALFATLQDSLAELNRERIKTRMKEEEKNLVVQRTGIFFLHRTMLSSIPPISYSSSLYFHPS